MRVAFFTLGCKVNSYETDVMAQAFRQAGDQVVEFDDTAEVYIVNTCTVTAVSDKKSRQALRAAKRRSPEALVVAVGCYAQVDAQRLQALPEVDLVLGNAGKPSLPALVREHLTGGRPNHPLPPLPLAFEPMRATVSGHTRATIKIQDGCDNFCSYCIIPYARGRVRSKPPEQALAEFEALTASGYLEIVLTGIEIAAYGVDLGCSLADLLRMLAPSALRHPGLRVRLGSLEPRVVTEPFVDALSQLPFVCPQFHLSLQSGSDGVLRRMNRKYDLAQYGAAAALLRERLPGSTLTTDIIAGFPGETEQEFEETLATVRRLDFLKVHVFPYSRRPGTPAAAMEGQLEQSQKAARAARLSALCEQIRREQLMRRVGGSFELLAERRQRGLYSGYSREYYPLLVEGPDGLAGGLMRVRALRMQDDALFCTMENNRE